MAARRARITLPLLLGLAGVALLVGCVPIPVFRRDGGEKRPESHIGPAGSHKPVQLGRATRDDVVRVLGRPETDAGSANALVYSYGINTIFWFPCYRQFNDRHLRLEFGDDGSLRDYKVFKSWEEARRPLKRR